MPTLKNFTHQEILILQHHLELHNTNQEKCLYCQQKLKEKQKTPEDIDTEENPFADTEYPHENLKEKQMPKENNIEIQDIGAEKITKQYNEKTQTLYGLEKETKPHIYTTTNNNYNHDTEENIDILQDIPIFNKDTTENPTIKT